MKQEIWCYSGTATRGTKISEKMRNPMTIVMIPVSTLTHRNVLLPASRLVAVAAGFEVRAGSLENCTGVSTESRDLVLRKSNRAARKSVTRIIVDNVVKKKNARVNQLHQTRRLVFIPESKKCSLTQNTIKNMDARMPT